MRLKVKVRSRARQDRVERMGDGSYKIWVRAVPENGRANRAVIEALSGHLGIPKSGISILSGQSSSEKVLEINQKIEGHNT